MNRVSILVLGLALLHAPSHAQPTAATPAPTTVSPFWSPPGWPQKWLVDGSQPATPAPLLNDKDADVGTGNDDTEGGDSNTIIDGYDEDDDGDDDGDVLSGKTPLTLSPMMVPAPSQDAGTPGQSGEKPGNGKVTSGSSNTKDSVAPAPTNLNGGKPHYDVNPPPSNGGGDKNPTNCPKGSVMVSVEGRGSFCVSSVGAICAGDNGNGRCPKKQPGLEKGSYCGKVKSGVFGCRPGPDPVKKCDVEDEDED
uniref:Uncharacterized protein n=1 Tax=Globisporangium ultimum (strain ATCC 200006 / CBS 805.95 / DAOM BR144) TaxID=431595 RepID=K3WVP8_GLOUD